MPAGGAHQRGADPLFSNDAVIRPVPIGERVQVERSASAAKRIAAVAEERVPVPAEIVDGGEGGGHGGVRLDRKPLDNSDEIRWFSAGNSGKLDSRKRLFYQ